MDAAEQKSFLEKLTGEFGFSHSGWTPLEKPVSIDLYREWIAQGLHGKMNYLADHLEAKENPQSQFPSAKSAFVFAMPYWPHPESHDFPLKISRVAAYAKGNDYHFWLKEKLRQVAAKLKAQFPDEVFEVHTDSSPLLERDLAIRAGLGWIGKNGCVIHPKKGSLFLLGEILTSLPFQEEAFSPLPDFCGTCRKCIEVCPTQALLENRQMDARRCISYLSIESREVPPKNLRQGWGDWLFGCDLCQTVCPWNQKPFAPIENSKRPVLELDPEEEKELTEELRQLLTVSGKKLEKIFNGTPLLRAGPFGLKRNALVVAGNRRLSSLKAEIESLKDHEKLGELASWALAQF